MTHNNNNTPRISDSSGRHDNINQVQDQEAGRCPDILATSSAPPPAERDEPWKAKARERNLYEAILAYVEAHDPVTFVELTRRLQPYCRVDGDRAVVVAGVSHIVLWAGVHQRFVDAVNRLIDDEKIHIAAANETVYAMQGTTINLPISDGPSVRNPVLQWCPVFLRPGNEAAAQPLSHDEIMVSAKRA